jgi:hypothetical protein
MKEQIRAKKILVTAGTRLDPGFVHGSLFHLIICSKSCQHKSHIIIIVIVIIVIIVAGDLPTSGNETKHNEPKRQTPRS